MARTWQLQEAKNGLSKVVDLAISEGPQTVTRHGQAVAVIVSKEEFDKRRGRESRGTLLTFFLGLKHFRGASLDLSRSKDRDRPVDL